MEDIEDDFEIVDGYNLSMTNFQLQIYWRQQLGKWRTSKRDSCLMSFGFLWFREKIMLHNSALLFNTDYEIIKLSLVFRNIIILTYNHFLHFQLLATLFLNIFVEHNNQNVFLQNEKKTNDMLKTIFCI